MLGLKLNHVGKGAPELSKIKLKICAGQPVLMIQLTLDHCQSWLPGSGDISIYIWVLDVYLCNSLWGKLTPCDPLTS